MKKLKYGSGPELRAFIDRITRADGKITAVEAAYLAGLDGPALMVELEKAQRDIQVAAERLAVLSHRERAIVALLGHFYGVHVPAIKALKKAARKKR